MMQTILTSETHSIYTLDSDLSYFKLLALCIIYQSLFCFVLEKITRQQAFTVLSVVTLVTLVGGTPKPRLHEALNRVGIRVKLIRKLVKMFRYWAKHCLFVTRSK